MRREWPDGDRVGAVTPDGRNLALGGDAGRVRLLDLQTGRSRRFDGSHEDGRDMRMVFAPDGRTLVTSAGEGEVIVWDVAGRHIRERVTGHTARVSAHAMSPDGRTLYTAGTDARLTLWDLAGERRLDRRFPAGPVMDFDGGWPKNLAVSPDGGTVAVTQMDGSVELRDARTLAVRRSARVFDGAALATAYSPDGKLLAVTGDGSRVLLRDAHTLAPVRELRGPSDGVTISVAISPDGRRLAASAFSQEDEDMPGHLQIWDLRTGTRVGRQREVGRGADDLAFSPDGRIVAAAAFAGDAAVFAAHDGREVATFSTVDFGQSVAFSPGGGLLALGQYDGSAVLLSTSSWKPVGGRLDDGHRARVTALEFSPDGRRLLTGSRRRDRAPVGRRVAAADRLGAAGRAGRRCRPFRPGRPRRRRLRSRRVPRDRGAAPRSRRHLGRAAGGVGAPRVPHRRPRAERPRMARRACRSARSSRSAEPLPNLYHPSGECVPAFANESGGHRCSSARQERSQRH